MNKKIRNIFVYPVRGILASVFVLLVAGSCFKKTEKTRYREIIPEKDFVSILTDLHMTNGLFTLPKMRIRFMIHDTSELYVEIIESYGYSTEAMDTTIQYYYIKRPKKLIQIYDQILGKFSEMETRVEQEYFGSPDYVADQWKGEPSYLLPDPGGAEKPYFEMTLIQPGTYALKFTVTVYPDDQSYDPRFTAWFSNADSSENGRKNYLPAIRYIKDGRPHTYTVAGTFTSNPSVVLKGWLCDYGSNPYYGEQNARIEEISFYYSGVVK